VGQKSKPPTDLSINLLKPADQDNFSLELNVEQATEVIANKHLLVLNILSTKYSTYDVKCDVNYCVLYFAIWVDDRRIRVFATENHRIFYTRSSANNLIAYIRCCRFRDGVGPYIGNNSTFLAYKAIY